MVWRLAGGVDERKNHPFPLEDTTMPKNATFTGTYLLVCVVLGGINCFICYPWCFFLWLVYRCVVFFVFCVTFHVYLIMSRGGRIGPQILEIQEMSNLPAPPAAPL